MYGESGCMLLIGQHIAHQGTERLHGDVDGGIHDHQHARTNQYRREDGGLLSRREEKTSIGHQDQSDRGQDGTHQKERTPTT